MVIQSRAGCQAVMLRWLPEHEQAAEKRSLK
jgi:hypothetical protein